jgi:HAD superfamily hydrolase (TIGR01549 family)
MRFAFFDLDDTLVDTAAALHAWALDFVARYGLGAGPGGDEAAAALAVRRRENEVETWREFAEQVGGWYGIAAPAQEVFEEIAATYVTKFSLAAEVAAGLDRLRSTGWLLGVITNGSTAVQHGKIDRIGLRAHVDVVLASEEAGYRKPDVRIFQLAAGKLGVTLGPEGWMVGDRLDKDVEGGLAAGLHTVWLPHGRRRGLRSPRPEHSAATIGEAFAILEAAGAAE